MQKRSFVGPLACAAALLLGVEGALRLSGFRYGHHPVSMRYVRTLARLGAEPTIRERALRIDYALDPLLLWRPLPQPGVTNSEGLLGREWTAARPQGVRRVIALGDSCTVAGEDPYPQRLERRLSRGGGRWEVLNAGVGSWSSYQGLRLFESRLARYAPDVVTIYFGWNDHWLAWAAPDKDLSRLLDRQWRLLKAVENVRLLQALLRVADALRSPIPRFSERTPLRVSLPDYAANLKALVARVREAGGEPVLLTAPTSLHANHPVAAVLCRRTHNCLDPARLRPIHDEYNEQVRAVARETGAALADLAAAFDRLAGADRLLRDGIHFTGEGHRKVAELLEAAVRTAADAKSPLRAP